ncbi:MAG: hypothetical protein ABL893_11000 [Hyphomicrobium sp.]
MHEYKPDGTVTPATLEKAKQGLALVILGRDMGCFDSMMIVAVRDGDRFSAKKAVKPPLYADRSTNVSQMELDPGDYYVVNYVCGKKSDSADRYKIKQITLGGDPDMGLLTNYFPNSFATFRVAAGEVVNLGSLNFQLSDDEKSLAIQVSEWPEEEEIRFRNSHPKLAEHMKTRLLSVTNGYATKKE